MDITFGTYTVSGSTNTTRITSHRVMARVEMQQPLRGASLIPVSRGGRAIALTIEVLHESESYTAAETLRKTIGTDLESLIAPSDTPRALSIAGRGTYSTAAVEDVDIRDLGVSTLVVWRFVTSGALSA